LASSQLKLPLQQIIHFLRRFWFALALVRSSCSEPALLNQARMDRRDSRLGLTQRLGACMRVVGAQDKVVIMPHSRAKDELYIGLRLEFDHAARQPEGNLPPLNPQGSVYDSAERGRAGLGDEDVTSPGHSQKQSYARDEPVETHEWSNFEDGFNQ
jgi:hypothetical protein